MYYKFNGTLMALMLYDVRMIFVLNLSVVDFLMLE